MVDDTDYWTLGISILPAICRRQICCVAVESQFLRGVKDGADIGYGLVGAAADQRPQLSASGWTSRH